jgi:hypothetical protein
MKQPIKILLEQICSETDGEEEEREEEEAYTAATDYFGTRGEERRQELFVYGGINTWPGILQRGSTHSRELTAHLAGSTWPFPAGYFCFLSLSLPLSLSTQ